MFLTLMKHSKKFNKFNYLFSTKKKREKICYYKLLNVSTSSSPEEIRKGYIEQAKKFHPDVSPGVNSFEEMFKEIQQAYSVLSDKNKRKIYDEENGIISYIYEEEKLGENYDKMSEKVDINKKIKVDQAFYEYFEAKYFKNTDFIYNEDKIDDELAVTPLLLRKKEELKKKKREYQSYKSNATNFYYDKPEIETKNEEKQQNSQKNKENPQEKTQINIKFNDKILFFSISLSFLTFYGIFKGFQDNNEEKERRSKVETIDFGSGLTVKSLPLSLF